MLLTDNMVTILTITFVPSDAWLTQVLTRKNDSVISVAARSYL